MREEHGDIVAAEYIGRRILARIDADALFAQLLVQRAVVEHVEIILHDVLPDRVGRGESAVGEHSVDSVGQIEAGGHEDGRRAHRDAGQVDRKLAGYVVYRPLHPFEAVFALEDPEAHVLPAAVVLSALLAEYDVASAVVPLAGHGAEVARPGGAPAVHGDYDAFRRRAASVVRDEFEAVPRRDPYLLASALLLELFSRRLEVENDVVVFFGGGDHALDPGDRLRLLSREGDVHEELHHRGVSRAEQGDAEGHERSHEIGIDSAFLFR